MDKSLILLKPDIEDDTKKRNYILGLIKNYLNITEQRSVILSEDDIDIIWPYCKHDPVCHWLMTQYVGGKELLLVCVEGNNALAVANRIKKKVRKIYGKSPFQNCVHAPSNEAEYHKDINCILNGKETLGDIYDKTVIGDFTRIKMFSLQEMQKCAEDIYRRLEITTFANYVSSKKDLKDYMLYVLNDNIHDAKYVASAILDFFPSANLLEAYWIAMGVDYIGKYPLIGLIKDKDLNEVSRAEILFESVGIKTERGNYGTGN